MFNPCCCSTCTLIREDFSGEDYSNPDAAWDERVGDWSLLNSAATTTGPATYSRLIRNVYSGSGTRPASWEVKVKADTAGSSIGLWLGKSGSALAVLVLIKFDNANANVRVLNWNAGAPVAIFRESTSAGVVEVPAPVVAPVDVWRTLTVCDIGSQGGSSFSTLTIKLDGVIIFNRTTTTPEVDYSDINEAGIVCNGSGVFSADYFEAASAVSATTTNAAVPCHCDYCREGDVSDSLDAFNPIWKAINGNLEIVGGAFWCATNTEMYVDRCHSVTSQTVTEWSVKVGYSGAVAANNFIGLIVNGYRFHAMPGVGQFKIYDNFSIYSFVINEAPNPAGNVLKVKATVVNIGTGAHDLEFYIDGVLKHTVTLDLLAGPMWTVAKRYYTIQLQNRIQSRGWFDDYSFTAT
jgi:hypothetical protein